MYYAIIILIIVLDQAFKMLVSSRIALGSSQTVLAGFLDLTLIHNYGAAFSILQNRQFFLIAFTAVVSLGILVALVKYAKRAHWTMLLSFAAIIGGGVGNMIDRIRYGYVIDFLEIKFISFPVFNLADIAVVAGSLLLIVHILFFDRHAERRSARDDH